jgi:hypothetical protein
MTLEIMRDEIRDAPVTDDDRVGEQTLECGSSSMAGLDTIRGEAKVVEPAQRRRILILPAACEPGIDRLDLPGLFRRGGRGPIDPVCRIDRGTRLPERTGAAQARASRGGGAGRNRQGRCHCDEVPPCAG